MSRFALPLLILILAAFSGACGTTEEVAGSDEERTFVSDPPHDWLIETWDQGMFKSPVNIRALLVLDNQAEFWISLHGYTGEMVSVATRRWAANINRNHAELAYDDGHSLKLSGVRKFDSRGSTRGLRIRDLGLAE